jgi:hypothetical protein
MRYLLDVNTLVALGHTLHVRHGTFRLGRIKAAVWENEADRK